MSDLETQDLYSVVTLVDRTGVGGTEFIFDGKRFGLKPGQTELAVPRFVAEWLLSVDQTKVWTTDGRFVSRFGVKDAPPDFLERLDPGAADTDLITIDGSRVEGWEAEATDPDRARATVLTAKDDPRLKKNPADYRERQGNKEYVFGARKGT